MSAATMMRSSKNRNIADRRTTIRRPTSARDPAARSATGAVGTGAPWPSRIQAGEVMTAPVGTVDVDSSMWEAARRLVGHDHAHLVVVDGARPVGIVNEQILAAHWPCGLRATYRRTLRDLGLPEVRMVLADDDVRDVAEIMVVDSVGAVPVVSRCGELVGLVSAQCLVELLAGRPARTPWPDKD